MRVEEQTKSGFFWLPSKPEKTFPGTLKIYDGGQIELELIGSSLMDSIVIEVMEQKNPGTKSFPFGLSPTEIPRINGLIDGGFVTLDQCLASFGFSFPGISKSTVYVERAFYGVMLNEGTVVTINKMKFSIEGLDEWVCVSGIRVSLDKNLRFSEISYSPLDEPKFQLDNGMSFELDFSPSLSGPPFITEAKISQKAFFQLIAGEEKTFDAFIMVAERITRFLTFALNEDASIRDVTIE